jgi:hypothetical protein
MSLTKYQLLVEPSVDDCDGMKGIIIMFVTLLHSSIAVMTKLLRPSSVTSVSAAPSEVI